MFSSGMPFAKNGVAVAILFLMHFESVALQGVMNDTAEEYKYNLFKFEEASSRT